MARIATLPGRLAALGVLLTVVLGGALSAHAQDARDFDALVAGLNAKSFKAKIKAVDAVAASGHERAADVLAAFLGGKLFARRSDGRIFMTERSGGVYLLTDAVTGADAGQAPGKKLRKVRVNNRVRVAIRTALGGLTLLSPDPAKRSAAADAVFKSPNAGFLPTLEAAIARETVEKIKIKLIMTRAAVQLKTGKTDGIKLTAIGTLSDLATPASRALLAGVVQAEGGNAVSEAAAGALAGIERKLAFWNAVGNIFQGLSLGSVLLLAAVGLAITFGVMGVINMAHGELVMLGAYTTFVIQEIFRTHFPDLFDWSIIVALPCAFAVSGAFGIAIERGIIRHLYGRPLETLLATWGLSLVLQQLVRSVFGPTNREVGSPSWMSGSMEIAGGFVLTFNRAWIILFSLLVLAALIVVFKKTAFGLQMRAVTQNRAMAGSMGIRTGWVDAMTFGLGAGIAGVAGVALSQIDNVSPNLGQAYIIDSFMVVVFGGVGNLWGTLVGAFTLGIVNKFLEPFAGAVLAKILVLVVIILFIQKRPRGLFALKGRAVEN